MKYFTNLPVINYSNNYVRNILTRVKFGDEYKQNSTSFYPYVQKESSGSLRYEYLAYDYYDDADDVWILHLFNEVIDPYYDVALTQADFDNYITKKYGSVRNAYQQILFYRNNYDQDDSIIDESGYNSLSEEARKYWSATVNFDNKILGYERIRENKIITFDVSLVGNTQFIVGEKVTQGDSSGFISFCNSSVVTVQHISGFVDINNIVVQSGYILGDQSLANAEITSANLVFNAFGGTTGSMSPNEEVYFSPVTAYDFENEQNELKKTINILDRRYVPDIHAAIKEIF
jgi:hypothetical protein